MTTKTTATAHVVDVCFPDYLTDHTGILVGVSRAGQTRRELIDQLVDEVCEHPDVGYGDLMDERIGAAIEAAIDAWIGPAIIPTSADTWRFWPVDARGREVTDPEVETPDDQPVLWVRVELEVEPLSIGLDNMDRRDGMVLVLCDDIEDARADQSIAGSHWEVADDLAYALVTDRPDLYESLRAEGYSVDVAEYMAPTEASMAALRLVNGSQERGGEIVWADYSDELHDALADLAEDYVRDEDPTRPRVEYWGHNGPQGYTARGWRVHLRGGR